jgi:hypothetical protein
MLKNRDSLQPNLMEDPNLPTPSNHRLRDDFRIHRFEIRRIARAIPAALLCVVLCGCGAMIDSMLGGPESCRDTCDETYQACLEQIGTPDATHYCLNRRNQCVANC